MTSTGFVRIIETGAGWSRRVAAGALMLSALRFGYVGSTTALAEVRPEPDPSTRSEPRANEPPPRLPWELLEPDIARPPASGSEPSVRMTLAVTVGAARSDVFVNGRKVGRTPFLGEVTCKGGRTVKVEVVPEKDPLIAFERRCRSGTVRLTEPDPPGASRP